MGINHLDKYSQSQITLGKTQNIKLKHCSEACHFLTLTINVKGKIKAKTIHIDCHHI